MLFVVPAVVLLLWATTVRLWHEMSILRAYVEHPELELARFARMCPELQRYRPWKGLGSKYDMPAIITAVLIVTSIAIGLAGTVGVIWPDFGVWFCVSVGCFALLGGGISFTFLVQKRHANKVLDTLEGAKSEETRTLRERLRSVVW